MEGDVQMNNTSKLLLSCSAVSLVISIMTNGSDITVIKFGILAIYGFILAIYYDETRQG